MARTNQKIQRSNFQIEPLDNLPQIIADQTQARTERLELPSPKSEVLPGIPWGRHDCLFTPSYWATQAWYASQKDTVARFRLGTTLVEEVAACLLGGHGMPSEVGMAAFRAVRAGGMLTGRLPTIAEVETILSRPLVVKDRPVRYRFWRQRSRYLVNAIREVVSRQWLVSSHREFRNALTKLDGIGPKTASWITRNWLDSDEVAILDVHVLRAGGIIGLFSFHENPSRDYEILERRFLEFAKAISVRASRLDALIWRQMKFAGSLAVRMQHETLHQQKRLIQ